MWRYGIAAFLAAHGFAHLVGFEGSWGLGNFKGQAEAPPVLSTVVLPDSMTLKLLGLLWLLGLAAFVVAAAAVALRTSWAVVGATTAAAISLTLSLTWWPTAVVGVVINLVILIVLAVVAVARHSELLARPIPATSGTGR